MNEGAGMMYGGNGGFGSGPVYMMGGAGERQFPEAPGLGAPRRWTPRKDRQAALKGDATAFGYDSDDSSLSSNASGSNKSGEKGEVVGCGWGSLYCREWRARRPRPRRIAPDRYLNCTYPFQVKFTPDDLLNGSEWDTLSQEIWEKFIKSQQTEETFRKKMNLWRYLYVAIKSIFPRYGLYVVGSTMSGFGLESSDMDLCLYVRPLHAVDPRAHALVHLNYILNYMKSYDHNLEGELIQAKVPILKFRDPHNGLQVDLNCNNVVGIRNTNLLYMFSHMDWRVRPLVAITKLWAGAHNINDAREQTLSSYSLTLMVIHFLQCGTSPCVLPRAGLAGAEWGGRARANRASLGELFLNMLRYYAEFPFDKMAVSVRLGCRLPLAECRAARSSRNCAAQWKLIGVEEPFDLSNTARAAYDPAAFCRVRRAFAASHARLALSRRLADAWPATATATAPTTATATTTAPAAPP